LPASTLIPRSGRQHLQTDRIDACSHRRSHFFLDARMDSFLRGHALAFAAFAGVPRVLLYDNLKSAVLERVGDAIRFNPQLLALAGHYRFEPRPVAPARGNEKGRVERAIRYIRDSFFAGRAFTVSVPASHLGIGLPS
jgi:transposase